MGTQSEGGRLAAVVDILDEQTVLTTAQLQAHPSAGADDLDPASLADFVASHEGLQAFGELVFSRSALLRGRTFTARTSLPNVAENHLDLAPFLGAQLRLDDPIGVAITSADRPIMVVGSLPSTLDGGEGYLAVGGSADLRTDEFGSLLPERFVVATVGSGQLSSGEVEVAALRSATERFMPSGGGLTALQLVAAAVALNDRCFTTPTLPLSDLFAAAGLVGREGQWGRVDDGWTTTAEDTYELHVGQLIAEHQLSPDEAGDLRSVVLQWEQWVGGRSTVNASSFVALLTGRVAAAFAELWEPRGVPSIEGWMDQRRLAETLARKHADHPAVNYLLGMIDLRLGDGGAAFTWFEKAHALDEDFLPVRTELGLLLLDAGRIEDALDVLPSDVPAFGAVEYLVEKARADRATVDKGELCRCGSGRKYKACCLRSLRLTLTERLDFIGIRLGAYLSDPMWSSRMAQLADVVSTEWELMTFPEALANPFVQDVLAIEGGGAASYLAARRTLLSQEDLEILSTYVAGSREAFDVTDVSPSSLILIEPDTGRELTAEPLERHAEPGDAVLTRTLAFGETLSPVGAPVLIPGSHVSLLRVMLGSGPTAEQLLGWMCRRTEILGTPVIDLRDDDEAIDSADDVLAALNIDDLARRAMES